MNHRRTRCPDAGRPAARPSIARSRHHRRAPDRPWAGEDTGQRQVI